MLNIKNVYASYEQPNIGAYSDYYLYYSDNTSSPNTVTLNDSVPNATQIIFEYTINSDVEYFSYYALMNCANRDIVGLAFYMEGPNEVFYVYSNSYVYNPNSVNYKPVPVQFTTAADQLIGETYFVEYNGVYEKYVTKLYVVITFNVADMPYSLIKEDLFYYGHYVNFGFSKYMYDYVENNLEHPSIYYTDNDENGYDDDSYYAGYLYGKQIIDTDSDGYDDSSYTAGKTAGENQGHYDGILWAYTNGFSKVGLDPMMSWDGQNYFADHIDETRIAITTFIPGILGSIFAFFFQLASIEFLGISALEVIAMFAVIAVSLLVFKAFFSK